MSFVYKTIKRKEQNLLTEQELNKFGADGWNLVSTFIIQVSIGSFIQQEVHYIFKIEQSIGF